MAGILPRHSSRGGTSVRRPSAPEAWGGLPSTLAVPGRVDGVCGDLILLHSPESSSRHSDLRGEADTSICAYSGDQVVLKFGSGERR